MKDTDSGKTIAVELQETSSASVVSKPSFKGDDAQCSTTFEGNFEIQTGTDSKITGSIRYAVEYSAGADGQDIEGFELENLVPGNIEITQEPEFYIEHSDA